MLRIDDKTDDRQRTIRTNDIADNVTFRGTITMPETGLRRTGVWLQLGRFKDPTTGTVFGPTVVSLNQRGLKDDAKWPNRHSLVRTCALVENYEPVDVLMTVTPIK